MSSLKTFQIQPLRDLTKSQVQEIARFESNCFKDAWDEKQWLSSWKENYYYLGTYRSEDQVVGLILCHCIGPEDPVALLKIVVERSLRGKGIGKIMLKAKGDHLGPCSFFINVRKSNHAAQKFYKNLGAQLLNEQKNFYQDGGPSLNYLLKSH